MIAEIISELIPIAFFAAAALPIIILIHNHFKRFKEKQETIRLMIEKGVEIPEGFLKQQPKPVPSKTTDLRRGVLCITTGLGVCMFLMATAGDADGAWTLGLIPVAVGIGYIINWKLTPDNAEDDAQSDNKLTKIASE